MNFSQSFFSILIIAALIMMAIGVAILIGMLFSDIKTKKLW